MLLCGALKCEKRWIPKAYETTKGCPRFYLQTREPILPWVMNVRNWEWKKHQTNWQVSFCPWILKVKKFLIEEYVQLAGEDIVDAQYNMAEVVDLA